MTAGPSDSLSAKVIDVITYHGWGGYFFEDLEKIRSEQIAPENRYHMVTDHGRYPFVRSPAPVVGIGLKMANGHTFWGDAVAVSFGGKSGRAGPSTPALLDSWIRKEVAPWFIGRTVNKWLATEESFRTEFPNAPAFVRYAVSQAVVGGVSFSANELPFKIMARELDLPIITEKIPLHGSSGSDWDAGVDRMLARNIPFLPQGQFENIDKQIGVDGENLLAWIRHFKSRASNFSYVPTLTLDFHGALDTTFNHNLPRIASFIASMAKLAAPHSLHIESPIVGTSLADHATRLAEIRRNLKATSPDTKIIADEWANEVSDIDFLIKNEAVDGIHIKMPDTGSLSECAKAVALCREKQIFCLLGGSCTETDIGARMSAHLALATRPDALLVKPGMGFDESHALLFNEMARSTIQ
jgi:methylaspartate ammonia-lyase